ncbi:ABC transporter permease [Pseudonocardia nigra]|uniref:ABC transporter permease n=1 Tax=Pseudonocardia nigra TaxID=1921578 RepID=UPI001C5F8EE3|nr:ABC transporter permease [Pseudonocardia nigra]
MTALSIPRIRARKLQPSGLIGAVAGVLAAFALWELLSRTDVLPSRYFPPASTVLQTLAEVVITPTFWTVVGLTVQSWALGLAIAAAIAVPLGLLLGASQRAYRFCRVVIEVLRPIPPVALIPLALLILGATLQMKLLLVVYGAVWPLLMQTIYGVRGVDPQALEMARAYRLTRLQRFFTVRLVGASAYIATGLRISATIALIVTIVAELVGGAPGLGNDILVAQASGADALMYALILVSGALGVAVVMTFQRIERAVLFWHPSQRGERG